MLRNYFIVAFRQLKKNNGFSLLNMFGLALGLSCAILILLWIQDEVSYDRFHTKYDRISEVMVNQTYDGKTFSTASTPGPLSAALKAEIPEVLNSARTGWGDNWSFSYGDKEFYERGNYVDPSFLELFSFEILYGNSRTIFPNTKSIVITDLMSTKFFGTTNSVGKYLKVNNKENYLISAVIKNPPLNSTLHFQWLAPFKLFEEACPWTSSWTENGLVTYVELKSENDIVSVDRKINNFIGNKAEGALSKPFLMPMKNWRLRSNFANGKPAEEKSRIQYVKIFGVISILLILIACINFMNLSTARAQKRAKEVGVRKAIGAQRSSLVKQFLAESLVTSIVAMGIACLLVIAALPAFNTFVDKKLSLGASNPMQWLIFLSLALFCGLISGSYPAFYLSSFKPVAIFKGADYDRYGSVAFVRKGLVMAQFITSIVLIIGTIIIYQQLRHIKNRDLGYNAQNVIRIDMNTDMRDHLSLVKQELLASGVVSSVASGNMIINVGANTDGFDWPGKDPSKNILISTDAITSGFFETAGIQLFKGRDFHSDSESDSSSVIINQSFADIINPDKEVLNTTLKFSGSEYKIVGIIKDYVYNDLYKNAEPIAMFCSPPETNTLFMRIKETADIETALITIQTSLKKSNPGYPFDYKFINDELDKKLANEALISKLSFLFALLTISISCIGLFGLAAYTAERRTKEVGIRKVLGASVSSLISLLSKDFLKLVVISFIIAAPIALYLMNKWLLDYAYRITIGAGVFVTAGCLALVIALMTVGFQAMKAARANPVKSLRTE
ncbi:acetylornithine deacetylase [Sphingobacteriaceae bacterium]|nr:acetylornithine deacetylase [Sphingobacteriaceae bacterium]